MIARPPKPANRASSPRFKKRQKRPLGLEAAFSALRALNSVPFTFGDMKPFERETRTKSDRGAAILLSTNLENQLQRAIELLLFLDSNDARDLFGSERSPLGTFSSKIRIARALRLLGPVTERNLDIIRSVRNAFAHTRMPITFKTPAIFDACSLLVVPTQRHGRKMGGDIDDAALSGRDRFTQVCGVTGFNLTMLFWDCPRTLKKAALIPDALLVMPADFELLVRPPPLP